jgi:hypothetical protein
MDTHSEQFQQAQAAVAEHLRKQAEAKSAGVFQKAPACTLRTACAVCGSIHGKAWSEKAKELCKNGCFWVLANHIAWNGLHKKVKFVSAADVILMARYRTYDQLVAAGRALDSQHA